MYVCLEVCMLVYGLHTIWPCEGAFKMCANIQTVTNRGQKAFGVCSKRYRDVCGGLCIYGECGGVVKSGVWVLLVGWCC